MSIIILDCGMSCWHPHWEHNWPHLRSSSDWRSKLKMQTDTQATSKDEAVKWHTLAAWRSTVNEEEGGGRRERQEVWILVSSLSVGCTSN